LERENGGAGVYQPDLKKRYQLKDEEWRYDAIPEIWEGKNIADFIDPNILVKLADLEEEEKVRLDMEEPFDWLNPEVYVAPKQENDFTKIVNKVKVMRITKKVNTGNRPLIARKHRAINLSEIEAKLKERGFDDEMLAPAIETTRSMSKAREGSKVRRSRSQSEARQLLDAETREGEDESLLGKRKRSLSSNSRSLSATGKHSGILDPRKQIAAIERGHKKQKLRNILARRGEGDRVILDMKPKHLYTGKHTVGKNDRR
jgi:nucleolar GTP-binding protein